MVIVRKSAYDLHSSCWHFETRWTIEMLMDAVKSAKFYGSSFLVHVTSS